MQSFMNRRKFISATSMAGAAVLAARYGFAAAGPAGFPVVRIPEKKRRFTSQAVESLIADVQKGIGNRELAWMFGNCFPNTLDTTVDFSMVDGRPDTYVITGDIDAMWLRDSSAQVWPYLPLCKQDNDLRMLIAGVINRQTRCILKDPYANAFYKNETRVGEWKSDNTAMQPGIHERKWEVDSLCYPIRLAHGYWKETGDTSPFDERWFSAMKLVVRTFREQQRKTGKGPYKFMRRTEYATDSLPLGGYGYPARPNGLICSMFRPSDDATVFPYLIPSNFFALESLRKLQEMFSVLGAGDGADITALIDDLISGLNECATTHHPKLGEIYVFETNGYGSCNLMDDANVPSLLSLAYLVSSMKSSEVYRNTRAFVLSGDNPFYFRGKVAEGIGGPHVGMDYIWPMSIAMRGITSTDDKEIGMCLRALQNTHAGTGFMHEAFHKDDPAQYTRSWFAWANTLFGEFIWKVYRENPKLLA